MSKFIAASLLLLSVAFTSAFAAPTAQLDDGKTTVRLDHGFVDALVALGIEPSAIGPGTLNLRRGIVRYPVVGGVLDLDSLLGDVFHRGGLRLSVPGTTVSLYNFVISTLDGAPVLTAVAAVNGDVVARIPVFNLKLNKDPRINRWGRVRIPGVGVTLTGVAADTLNDVFDETAFVEGFKIGRAVVRTQIVDVEYDDDDEDDDDDD